MFTNFYNLTKAQKPQKCKHNTSIIPALTLYAQDHFWQVYYDISTLQSDQIRWFEKKALFYRSE